MQEELFPLATLKSAGFLISGCAKTAALAFSRREGFLAKLRLPSFLSYHVHVQAQSRGIGDTLVARRTVLVVADRSDAGDGAFPGPVAATTSSNIIALYLPRNIIVRSHFGSRLGLQLSLAGKFNAGNGNTKNLLRLSRRPPGKEQNEWRLK